ncbi:MAG: SH3 domain-containing protein [Spirochaetales bacterium]|mgnify:FL=1|jgi:hypothetical protein|nr:SH3 domain-containing protein [Spirochaetales bacterium]
MTKKMWILIAALWLFSTAVYADMDNELIEAVKSGDAQAVLALLDAGADANAKNSASETVLTMAAFEGHDLIAALLLAGGAVVRAVLNDSGVRMRNRPTTANSKVVGSLNQSDQVFILSRSKNQQKIQDMNAYWYKLKTDDGIVGYSYGYFFDVNEWEKKVLPTYYLNYEYGFSIEFHVLWEDWSETEELINFGFGVEASVVYFGLPDQDSIFAVGIYTEKQWNVLSDVEPPDGLEGPPIAQNNFFRFDYSLGHYAANDEMHKRRGEVSGIMKSIEVFEPEM